jgi:hypothetical protein
MLLKTYINNGRYRTIIDRQQSNKASGVAETRRLTSPDNLIAKCHFRIQTSPGQASSHPHPIAFRPLLLYANDMARLTRSYSTFLILFVPMTLGTGQWPKTTNDASRA